jgi:hypothetical protein
MGLRNFYFCQNSIMFFLRSEVAIFSGSKLSVTEENVGKQFNPRETCT